MNALPMTVVSGYLGAGKTTLGNRLLGEDHGLSLMVMVNDFGAINIDAALLASVSGDTLELTNGCVCCTMGADLFMALGDALDRRPRPDHLIVEASGIADPAAIANAAIAEPELSYAGIVTLVDALNIAALLDDPLIAAQVAQQITAADLTLLSKAAALPETVARRLDALGATAATAIPDAPLAPLLFGVVPLPGHKPPAPHPAYAHWQWQGDDMLDRAALGEKLAARPEGLYRLKGFVRTTGGCYEIHAVGRELDARRCEDRGNMLVGIGPAARITPAEIDAWWQQPG